MTITDVPRSATLLRLLSRLGPFIALILLMVAFRLAIGETSTGRTFWSADNLRTILVQTSIVAISACGMTMIIVAGGIDLSVGSAIALTSVVGALVLKAGHDPLLAIAAAMGVGLLVGVVNGGIVAAFGIAPFIVTLGMMGVARGSAKLLAGSSSVNFNGGWLQKLMLPQPPAEPAVLKWLVVAPGVWIAALTAMAMAVVMRRSVFGRNAYAIGSNEAAARLCGIPVPTTKIAIYALAGILFGLSGALTMAKQGQGNSTAAVGLELDVIAAVVIGGASLSGGAGTILGTIIGALIMSVLRSGTDWLEWGTPWQEILIGMIIVIAVGIDRLRNRKAG
jgi:ribose transport system permease protein